MLFGEKRPGKVKHKEKATQAFQEWWRDIVLEATEKYQPDLYWFDFGSYQIIDYPISLQIYANIYNFSEKNGYQAGIMQRDKEAAKYMGVVSLEKGSRGFLDKKVWNKCTSIAKEWFARSNESFSKVRSSDEIIHDLVDVVSKNGTYLLNVGPKSDGSFKENHVKVMHEIGDWLKVNGEAIYNTRPWLVYGEGPKGEPAIDKLKFLGEPATLPFSASDIRYTMSKDGKNLYAIVLGQPRNQTINFKRINATKTENARIALLGIDASLDYKIAKNKNIIIKIPKNIEKNLPAYAFKISGFDLKLSENHQCYAPRVIPCKPSQAVIKSANWGQYLCSINDKKQEYLSRWKFKEEYAQWTKQIRTDGEYEIYLVYKNHEKGDELELHCDNQKLSIELEVTDWSKTDELSESVIGIFNIKKGMQTIKLQPNQNKNWKGKDIKIFGLYLRQL